MDCRIASPWEPAQLDKKPEELHGLPQEPQGPAGAHLCHQVTTGRWTDGHKDKNITLMIAGGYPETVYGICSQDSFEI